VIRREMPMRVVKQGSVEVDHAWIARDYGDLLIVFVDAVTKYPLASSGGGDPPEILLHSPISSKSPLSTVLQFHEHAGWNALITEACKYTVTIALTAPGWKVEEAETEVAHLEDMARALERRR
jgi:hypothetical protein